MRKFYFCLLFSIILLLHLSAQNKLEKGSLFVYAVNSNVNSSCPTQSFNQVDYVDEIFLVTFNDIPVNTVLYLTDNGWQRKYNNYFGSTEGVIKLTKKSTSLQAGEIFSIKIPSSYTNVNLNNLNTEWDCEKVTNGIFGVAIADQLYIFRDGNWEMDLLENHKGEFRNATIITAYNNTFEWNSFVDSVSNETLNSGLIGEETDDPYDITDFHFTAGLNSAYLFYKGFRNEVSENEWKLRFLNPTYWKTVPTCTLFNQEVIKDQILINNQAKTYRVCKDSESKLEVDNNNIVSYQWYQSNSEDLSNSQLISGANTNIYFPSTSIVGTSYYYCQLNYTLNWQSSGLQKSKTSTLLSVKFKVEVFENTLTPIEY